MAPITNLPHDVLYAVYNKLRCVEDAQRFSFTCKPVRHVWVVHSQFLLELIVPRQILFYDAALVLVTQQEESEMRTYSSLSRKGKRRTTPPSPTPYRRLWQVLKNEWTVLDIAKFYMRFTPWYHKQHPECQQHLHCFTSHHHRRTVLNIYFLWALMLRLRPSLDKAIYVDELEPICVKRLKAATMPNAMWYFLFHLVWWLKCGHLYSYDPALDAKLEVIVEGQPCKGKKCDATQDRTEWPWGHRDHRYEMDEGWRALFEALNARTGWTYDDNQYYEIDWPPREFGSNSDFICVQHEIDSETGICEFLDEDTDV